MTALLWAAVALGAGAVVRKRTEVTAIVDANEPTSAIGDAIQLDQKPCRRSFK